MSKKAIRTAVLLMLSGCVLFLGVMSALNWDFARLSTIPYATTGYTVGDPFTDICIITDTAHVSILPAEDRITAVDCHEMVDAPHTVSVKNGTLTIQVKDNREWYQHVGIQFDSPWVSVYLPAGVYSNLTVQTATGNVEIAPDFRFNTIDVDVTTGNVTNRASAVDTISICTSTGRVHLDGCDAAALDIQTSTGDVTGHLLTGKTFVTHTSTGRVSVPASATGGRCTITTSTGDITMTISE